MEKTENNLKNAIAKVKSPSRDAHLREGNGFSLSEIKAAGKTIAFLKEFNVKIDYFRKSKHKWNIEQLKTLKPLKKKLKEKKPYLPKEERIKIRRKVRRKVKPIKEMEILPDIEELEIVSEAKESEPKIKKEVIKTKPVHTTKVKATTPPKTKVKKVAKAKETIPPKIKVKKVAEEKAKIPPKTTIQEEDIPLTKLSGLGATTSKKFKELGVESIQQLIEEDPEELSMLISGVSVERISKWIEEGKELLNK
ncbi:MAG: helix-hairpin-helix domain-containing protein [Promethearchaeota archaeon]